MKKLSKNGRVQCSKMTLETKELGALCTAGELGEYEMAKKKEKNLQGYHYSLGLKARLPDYTNDIHHACTGYINYM